MDKLAMIGVVDALQKRMLRRIDFLDSDYSDIVNHELQADVLKRFDNELHDLSESQSLAWLIKKVVHLEARFNALLYALNQKTSETDHFALPELVGDEAAWGGRSREPPNQVGIDMDNDVLQMGFYNAELTDDGKWFRWLGPDPVGTVYLTKTPAPLEVTIHVVAVHGDASLSNVRVALNGGDWTHLELGGGLSAPIVRCRPPSGPRKDNITDRLDIDCGVTSSPADMGHNDSRKLGIAISRVEIASG